MKKEECKLGCISLKEGLCPICYQEYLDYQDEQVKQWEKKKEA